MQQDEETDWTAIVASVDNGDEPQGYIHITPAIVAILSLKDCEEQLKRAGDEKLRLAQAMKSAHLAVQAALTAALAGSMNIGAHPEKLRISKLAHYQDGTGERPDDDRVLAFKGLLKRAMSAPLEWTHEPLTLSEHEEQLLERLCFLRDGIEHPKQSHWGIEIAYILEPLPVAARTAVTLLEVVVHHLEPGELDQLEQLAAQIETHCDNMQEAL
ncbi:hypothetical protein GRI62_10645 [Erythrobacter arachoides]|uniref:Uncharacterized protein n=1 Tax=Aurantiacibacter arachoides TaxID=1850444 RepID=A0A845A910_9SPHN|nr:hypothetical protein [Aurantiacibacter arachoides]MXO94059.1 hypothetical protein [Aurantiacibacter arachoides]GGD44397.1 hypothetical protein GCM10011411_00080 [Aurantiacibacter arachoides]